MRFYSTCRVFILLGLFFVSLAVSAQRRTISGYVMDAESKETLIGATVVDERSGKGCVSNSYGFYTLTLNPGDVNLQVSYVGYSQQQHSFTLTSDTTLSVSLSTNIKLNEVVVEASRGTVSARSSQMNMVEKIIVWVVVAGGGMVLFRDVLKDGRILLKAIMDRKKRTA